MGLLDRLLGRAPEEAREPPVYETICAQLRRDPDGPVTRPEPPVRMNGLTFAAGAEDALFGAPDDRTVRLARRVVARVRSGLLDDPQELETALRGARAAAGVDGLLAQLRPGELPAAARAVFWRLALEGRDLEAVKWGVALGALEAEETQVEALLRLVRHPELTAFAAVALLRAAPARPELRRRLVALLPATRQWAVVRLVLLLLEDGAVRGEPEAQRAMLLAAMENHDGLAMEVAFPLARALDLPHLFALAREDGRVRAALLELMQTLIDEPAPLGGLRDLPDAPALLDALAGLAERAPADVRLLDALDAAARFLAEAPGEAREGRAGRIDALRSRLATVETVRAGLREPALRWRALRRAGEQRLVDLLPDVEALVRETPDHAGILALSRMGGRDQLRLLLEVVPRLVDLDARARQPRSLVNVQGPPARHALEYAQIVRSLGRLGTPEARAHLKRALADFDPAVRAAACQAVADLDAPDDALRVLLRERFDDRPPYVAEAARAAARKLSL